MPSRPGSITSRTIRSNRVERPTSSARLPSATSVDVEAGEVEVQPHDFADSRLVFDEQGAASGLRSVGHGRYYPAVGRTRGQTRGRTSGSESGADSVREWDCRSERTVTNSDFVVWALPAHSRASGTKRAPSGVGAECFEAWVLVLGGVQALARTR